MTDNAHEELVEGVGLIIRGTGVSEYRARAILTLIASKLETVADGTGNETDDAARLRKDLLDWLRVSPLYPEGGRLMMPDTAKMTADGAMLAALRKISGLIVDPFDAVQMILAINALGYVIIPIEPGEGEIEAVARELAGMSLFSTPQRWHQIEAAAARSALVTFHGGGR
jgi:hypothetical protein